MIYPANPSAIHLMPQQIEERVLNEVSKEILFGCFNFKV